MDVHGKTARCDNSKALVVRALLVVAFGLAGFGFSARAATEEAGCAANPESQRFDYWLGNWTIGAPGSSGNAHSKVTLDLDKCLVVENWDGGRGHRGENIFGFSADDKSWYGMFADNEGRVHVFDSGKVSSGSAEFEGKSRGPKGETVLNRVRIIRVSRNKVEQIWEKSTDDGNSWSVAFRGEYSRVSP